MTAFALATDRGGSLPPPAAGWSQIELSGFSGARILLMRHENETAFIRKISASREGNSRLQEQAIKQRFMVSLLGDHASTPAILSDGYTLDQHYYFDMEYVRGLDGISFLRSASLPEIRRFSDQICAVLGEFAEPYNSLSSFSPRDASVQKCLDVLETLKSSNPEARDAVSSLLDIVRKADLPDTLPLTACHGDMTLENIVVREDGRVVFIDLLETFFTHWSNDIAKLDQDLKAGWYERKSPPLPVGIKHFLRKEFQKFATLRIETASNLISILSCIHVARILPYSRTEQDRRFVLERLQFLLGSHPSF